MQHVLTPYAAPVEPFVWWDGAFTEEELNWLQNKAKNADHDAGIGRSDKSNGVNKDVRRSQIGWMNKDQESTWVFERLADVASRLNYQYFRLDLLGFGEPLQLTNYNQSEHGMYGWHQDYNAVISRKLSLVLQLTDPSEYEGGNLQIMTGIEIHTVKKQRGLIAAFPSYVVHQVTPVTSGTRQSLVAWISGPQFR